MNTDLLDSVLGLEDEFYNEGYVLGTADGTRAGYLEGKAFGLEKGFEKFLEMGKLHGKATLWAMRLPPTVPKITSNENVQSTSQPKSSEESHQPELPRSSLSTGHLEELSRLRLPLLPANPRLEKHINTLLGLADPATLCTDNTEQSIAEFDDRLRKAQAKAKVIEKVIGEPAASELSQTGAGESNNQRKAGDRGDGSGNIEDISSLRVRH